MKVYSKSGQGAALQIARIIYECVLVLRVPRDWRDAYDAFGEAVAALLRTVPRPGILDGVFLRHPLA